MKILLVIGIVYGLYRLCMYIYHQDSSESKNNVQTEDSSESKDNVPSEDSTKSTDNVQTEDSSQKVGVPSNNCLIKKSTIKVKKDEYTKSIVVTGERYGICTSGFDFGRVYFEFENDSGKNYILVTYDRKDMNLNKKCSLHILLTNNTVIITNPIAKPVKSSDSYSTLKFPLSNDEMLKMEKESIKKWRFTNEASMVLKSGTAKLHESTCVYHCKNKKNSYCYANVIKDFIKKFNDKVHENIPEEELRNTKKDIDDTDKNNKLSCYVYLMIDTTNNFHKIGISNNPRYREHTLQSDKPTIELICAKEYPSRTIAEAIESALHNAYANKRIRGEWFNLEDNDIIEIKQTLKS